MTVRDEAPGTPGPRHVRLMLDPDRLRQWHLDLLERLRGAVPGRVDAVPAARGAPAPSGLALLFELERLVFGLRVQTSVAGLSVSRLPAISAETPDLTIDLSADLGPTREGERRWTILFDGAPGEDALLAALVAGRSPVAEIREGSQVVASGRIGTEYGGVLRASLEDCLARTATLILAALAALRTGQAPPRLPPSQAVPASKVAPSELSKRMARLLTLGVARRLYRLCFHSPHWRVGWRRIDGRGNLWDLGGRLPVGWQDLPDDGRRFYADPFAIEREGRLWLFVEDYEHRLGKGIISAVEMGPSGPLDTPRPVLEHAVHLSYPFVFERDGEVWMVPETGGAGTIELFRATSFPGGWVREATLVSGVVASDATLIEENGLWWLFATVRDGGGAFSDALHLWSAPDFRGPWTPHPANPVLIDIASARPAGAMIRRNGVLWRPVQDCGPGYGAALGLARVDRLDGEGFAQTVETVVRPGPNWPGRRLHSLNAAGGFEFIDGSAAAPLRFDPRQRR